MFCLFILEERSSERMRDEMGHKQPTQTTPPRMRLESTRVHDIVGKVLAVLVVIGMLWVYDVLVSETKGRMEALRVEERNGPKV